jgi:hypothetical protein
MIKTFIITLLLALTFLAPPVHAFDLFGDNVCKGQDKDSQTIDLNSDICKQSQSQGSLDQNSPKSNPVINVINTAATILAIIGGLLAVIMIIIAGFAMVTSAGNSEQVTNARRRIVSAIVGLIIIALAWVIIRFITDKLLQ